MSVRVAIVLFVLLITTLVESRPQNEADSSSIGYSFLPKISADLDYGLEKGANVKGAFGFVDVSGWFTAGSVVIVALILLANFAGVAIMPAVSDFAKRFDLGLGASDVKRGVVAVSERLKGSRNLDFIDDATLDAVTSAVLEAINAYEHFN